MPRNTFKAITKRKLRFKVVSEFGDTIIPRCSYQVGVASAHKLRTEDRFDYFVVDTRTGRAVSEVPGFDYDS